MKRHSDTRRRRGGARLGQHFLTGTWAAKKLVEAADIGARDTVLEIGPGTGALTKELLKTGANVVAVEKDDALVAQLRITFSSEMAAQKLTLIQGDVRDLDLEATRLGTYILAANIPYYITGEILRTFLSSQHQPRTMALLVQKEVAERIIARDGKEGILSISVKAYGEPGIAAKVARGNFSPPPSVDSAILVVRNISKKAFKDISETLFFRVVRAGFASKRKMLAGNLAKEFGKERSAQALERAGVAGTARAEDIPLQQWFKIAKGLQ